MKVAIIGRGFGSYAMKPAFEGAGWDVELVPSRDDAAVAAACDGPYDLIAVHSPPFQHREHVMKAIAAGKDVLCDKPFGKNGAEAREMRDAAKAAGILHFVNFEFRHDAVRAKVEELLRSGAIGTLQHASYLTCNNFMRGRDHGWLNEAEQGGGWLGALGSHVIDMMRWQLGSDVVDCGGMSRLDVPVRPDGKGGEVAGTAADAFAFWMTFANGATATIEAASASAVNLPQRVVYLGTNGAIEVGDSSVTLLKEGSDPEIFEFSADAGAAMFSALGGWVGAVEQALTTRTQITPSFDDGVAVGEVMDMLKERFVSPPSS
ncbi:MAG: Gfo/Idh/MocA family oxidoreductase [Novosphingobium sp.]|nr:Gfo/Idh/MocA family oxidoreductase [Novosphingobium sp.]